MKHLPHRDVPPGRAQVVNVGTGHPEGHLRHLRCLSPSSCRFIGIFYCILVAAGPLYGMIDLIDVPTAEVIDYSTVDLNFRLYSGGGILSKVSFGVFKRLNIGCSWDVDRLIGMDSPEARPPKLNLKFRLFEGTKNLPALAIGYDGQGYRYDRSSGTYLHKEKGIYFVGDSEILLKNLQVYSGININFSRENNRDKTNTYGFFGLSYTLMEDEIRLVSLLTEYDNLFKDSDENLLNAGIRIFPAENLYVDFAIKDIASPKNLPEERIVRITYRGQF